MAFASVSSGRPLGGWMMAGGGWSLGGALGGALGRSACCIFADNN